MIRRFRLLRVEDASGVSGTGYVAEGAVFTNGKVVLSWTSRYTSIAIYDDFSTMETIHGHGGRTVVEWMDLEPTTAPADAVALDPCPICRHVPMTKACPFRCKS